MILYADLLLLTHQEMISFELLDKNLGCKQYLLRNEEFLQPTSSLIGCQSHSIDPQALDYQLAILSWQMNKSDQCKK